MVKVIDMRVPTNKYGIKSTYKMSPTSITIHNTANTALARNEVNYMRGNNNMTSFHVAIDHLEAVQALPFTRNSWAAGDGLYGEGNRRSIHIEICFSMDNGYSGKYSKRHRQAELNAVEYVAHVLLQYNWNTNRLRQHWDWSRKDCPHKMRAWGNWGRFKNEVASKMNAISKPKKSAPAPTSSDTYTVKKGDSLWSIAKKHKTTVVNIKKLNGLSTDVIKVGQKLKVKGKATAKKVTVRKSPPNEWYWAGTFTANTTIAVRSGLGLAKPLVGRASWLKSGQWVNFNRLYYRDGHWWIRFKYPTNPSAGWFFMTVGQKQHGITFRRANELNRLWGKVSNLDSNENTSGIKDWTRKDGVK